MLLSFDTAACRMVQQLPDYVTQSLAYTSTWEFIKQENDHQIIQNFVTISALSKDEMLISWSIVLSCLWHNNTSETGAVLVAVLVADFL